MHSVSVGKDCFEDASRPSGGVTRHNHIPSSPVEKLHLLRRSRSAVLAVLKASPAGPLSPTAG
jgi:hypothetical protein